MTNPLKTMNIESDSAENMNFFSFSFFLKKKNKENNKFKEHKGEGKKKLYTENLKISQQESQQ